MAPRNILLILADQWRADCLGAMGHPLVRTPNLDALAADGVLFRQHFVQAAPCAPSRASFWTGMYQMNHRVCRNGTPLDARHSNLALELRDAGYDPVLFGYTDTAADPRGMDPADPRLTSYEGILPGIAPVVDLTMTHAPWARWLRARGHKLPDDPNDLYLPAGTVDPVRPSRAPTKFRADETETAFLAGAFLDWLDGKAMEGAGSNGETGPTRGDGPFCAHLAFIRPHPPMIAPEPYNTMYDPDTVPAPVRAGSMAEERRRHPYIGYAMEVIPQDKYMRHCDGLMADLPDEAMRQIRATYYGMVGEVDEQIGRVIAGLKERGLYDETLIIISSDHGEMLGDHFMWSKLGYFDQAFQVPMLMRVPGYPGGQVVDAFTELVDVMPTVLDWLDLPIPRQCDGRSVLPFARGRRPADWRQAVHWEYDFREVRDARPELRFGMGLDDCALAVIRDDAFKYVHFAALPPLLFDLRNDPGELRNLAAEPSYAPVVTAYAQRMLSWRMRHADKTLTHVHLGEGGAHARGPTPKLAPNARGAKAS